MAIKAIISGSRATWPGQCPCCLGNTETTRVLVANTTSFAARMANQQQITTWHVPCCEFCKQHMLRTPKIPDTLGIISAIVLFPLGILYVFILLLNRLLTPAKLGPACAGQWAVSYAWSRRGHVFIFQNEAFGREFAELNGCEIEENS